MRITTLATEPVKYIINYQTITHKNKTLGKTISTVTKQSVLAMDLRNHGLSPHHSSHKYVELAEDVLELMNKLEVRKAILVGHSMGGRTSMTISLMAVRKFYCILVLVGTYLLLQLVS